MTPRQRLKSITDDFGEPAADVIHGFAKDGYSPEDTAQILEIPFPDFRRILDLRDWWPWFREDDDRDSGAVTSHRNKLLKVVTYKCITDKLCNHADRQGLNYATVSSRMSRRPGDWKYILAPTSHVRPPANTAHAWRSTARTSVNESTSP